MHSHFSLRYGILSPHEVLQHYVAGGFDYALMADVNNTSESLNFVRMAQKEQVRALVGVDFRNGATRKYLVVAKNNEGFRQINVHLSDHLETKRPFGERAPLMSECLIFYPFGGLPKQPMANEYELLEPLEVQRYEVLCALGQIDARRRERMVALPTMSFRHQRDFNTHRLLRAIDNNMLLSKLPGSAQASPNDRYRTREEVEQCYAAIPECLERADQLLHQCSFHFNFGTEHPHKNQQTYTGSHEEDDQLIRRLCAEGMSYRYPKVTPEIEARIEKELQIISEKKFTSYFLINWDITRYARSKGYFYVGRGSGANSVVAYILRITDVDPIELDLYFERFINLYRQNPPDFDIDFSWTDREDITRYIFERFENVCLLGAYNTFQYRAVVRELGKVFGLPKHEIDRIAEGGFKLQELDELSRLVVRYSERIHGFPNNISIHAAGILITEHPIQNYTATFMPPKGFPTAQFDMVIAEDAGIYKFDILSQRGLAKIRESLDIIAYNHPEAEEIDIHDMKRFKQDERIKHLLRNAEAIGCFYVESPAMRMLMRKLRVDDYLGLVAASSVIRPGVAKSGMMREYILRYRFPERREDAHPIMREIMPETYGVMVYQEDVIKVAHYFAGLTLGEADVLRRGMSGKFRSRDEFNKAKQKFFDNCRKKGHSDELTAEVWRQTESFAGYAFAKGHSASYAVESYQSLFLKAYYPLEYMVATINNFGGFYRTELYVHEARMLGATIEEPCVNRGGMSAVIEGKTILLGLIHVKGIDERTGRLMLAARKEAGAFASLEDFVDRVPIGLEQLTLLIRCNAFRFTGKSKKELLWNAHFLLGHARKRTPVHTLFRSTVRTHQLPELYTAQLEDAFDQIELFGFPLCNPFELLRDYPSEALDAAELEQHIGETVTVVGYLVTAKMTSTVKRDKMFFGTFIDRKGAWLDSVHFPQIAAKYPFRGRGIYKITGKVVEEFDCLSVEAAQMEKLPIVEDPRYAEKKAFEKTLMQNSADRSRSRGTNSAQNV